MGYRGPRKHLKRFNAPKHWMLDKLTGVWAPRPSTGPHKLRESLPLIVLLRNRLKYALTGREVTMILMNRFVKVDGKVRTDKTYPAGFMDVISIPQTNETFRLLYDVKGRFVLHKLKDKKEGNYKLCRVTKVGVGAKGVPYIVTHDGRTIRYPDPKIKVNDTVKFYISGDRAGQLDADFIKFATDNKCMVTGGHNIGRVGVIKKVEKHPGSFEIIHVEDVRGNKFATRKRNIFVIGAGKTPWVTLPKQAGIKRTIMEDREKKGQ